MAGLGGVVGSKGAAMGFAPLTANPSRQSTAPVCGLEACGPTAAPGVLLCDSEHDAPAFKRGQL